MKMCGIKHTVILTLNDCEVKGTDGALKTHNNNLTAWDGSYLKENSTPLLDLLQNSLRHTMEGVKEELPQCTTPLSSPGVFIEDTKGDSEPGVLDSCHVGSFGFSYLWADLLLDFDEGEQAWPGLKVASASFEKWMLEAGGGAQGTAVKGTASPSDGIKGTLVLVLFAIMGNIMVGKDG